jgi:hypothetical protein
VSVDSVAPEPNAFGAPNFFTKLFRRDSQAGFLKNFTDGRSQRRFTSIDSAARRYPSGWQHYLGIKVRQQQKYLIFAVGEQNSRGFTVLSRSHLPLWPSW